MSASYGSIKPEDDDEEAKRQMDDEMRGLMCGTNLNTPYDGDDTASEEDCTSPEIPQNSNVHLNSTSGGSCSSSGITCKVCTTHHSPPIPMCCESCNNVLEPEKCDHTQKWICKDTGCHGLGIEYVNSLDVGRCGLCGSKRLDSSLR